jgi:predicted O-methyltransferase YrrM
VDANAFVSSWLVEDPPLVAARARATDVGIAAISPAVGSLLRWLAISVDARTVVETGTGTGVSGLWLLAGMRRDGTLTSVDVEPEHQRLARSAFLEAGIPPARTRLIAGDALDVLPRLADHGYDLVLLDSAPRDLASQLVQARRLLRLGGVAVVHGVLRGGRAPEGVRDPEAAAVRDLLEEVRADETLVPALLPLGDGLLVLRTAP